MDLDLCGQLRQEALRIIEAGVPILIAPPVRGSRREFRYQRWKHPVVDPTVLDRWRPGWMLAAVCGIAFDVIDIDPRHGGDDTLRELEHLLPTIAGEVATPGGGRHLYVAPAGTDPVKFGGIDYQARGTLIFIPGCSRPRYGGRGYRWVEPIDWSVLRDSTFSGRPFVAEHRKLQARARGTATPGILNPAISDRPRGTGGTRYGREALFREADQVAAATTNRNDRLNRAAFRMGQLIADGCLDRVQAINVLLDAAEECGLLREDGSAACAATIDSGMRAGTERPRSVPPAVR